MRRGVKCAWENGVSSFNVFDVTTPKLFKGTRVHIDINTSDVTPGDHPHGGVTYTVLESEPGAISPEWRAAYELALAEARNA